MATKVQRIRKIIRDFNDTWDLNIEISRIILWNKEGAAYQPMNDKGWISINPNQSFQEIEEDVIHELGHALIHQYKIHLSKLRIFHDHSPKYSLPYINRMHIDEDELPPYGFVSWYATLNGSEDFCETLSAYVSNNYSFNRMIYFENKIPVGDEPKLQKKLLAILNILENLSENARAVG